MFTCDMTDRQMVFKSDLHQIIIFVWIYLYKYFYVNIPPVMRKDLIIDVIYEYVLLLLN